MSASNAPTAPSQAATATTTDVPQPARLQFHDALPIPHSPSLPDLTPGGVAAGERVNWLSAPASARTSFTRVDQTRVGTPLPEEGEGSGADDNYSASGRDAQSSSSPVAPAESVPQASVTFLLVSGRRRSMNFEPETTIGRVKELVWNTWPSDWQDERPPAPAYLRILFRGRMLQDSDTLTGLAIPTSTSSEAANPTIMHLSVRPIPSPEEGAGLKKKRSRRGPSAANPDAGEVEEAGCCAGCVIA